MGFFDIFRRGESESVIMYKPSSKEELKALVRDNNIRLSQIDISAVDDLEGLFKNSKREDFSGIEKWDVGHVKKFGYMFSNCEHFNADISKWDTHSATSMTHMFVGCRDFDRDLSHWDVSGLKGRYKASYIKNMFAFADKMNLRMEKLYAEYSVKLGSEKVFSVMPFPAPKTVDKMIFFGRHSSDLHNVVEHTEDLSTIDVSAVTSLNNLFKNSTRKIFTGIKNWSLESVKTAKNFLYGAKNFKDEQLPDMPEVEIADNLVRDTEYNQAIPKLDKAVSIEGAFSDIDNFETEKLAEAVADNKSLKYTENAFNKADLQAFANEVNKLREKGLKNNPLQFEYMNCLSKNLIHYGSNIFGGRSDLTSYFHRIDDVIKSAVTNLYDSKDKSFETSSIKECLSNLRKHFQDFHINSNDISFNDKNEWQKEYSENDFDSEYVYITIPREFVKYFDLNINCKYYGMIKAPLGELKKDSDNNFYNTFIIHKADLTDLKNKNLPYSDGEFKLKNFISEISVADFMFMNCLFDLKEEALERLNNSDLDFIQKSNCEKLIKVIDSYKTNNNSLTSLDVLESCSLSPYGISPVDISDTLTNNVNSKFKIDDKTFTNSELHNIEKKGYQLCKELYKNCSYNPYYEKDKYISHQEKIKNKFLNEFKVIVDLAKHYNINDLGSLKEEINNDHRYSSSSFICRLTDKLYSYVTYSQEVDKTVDFCNKLFDYFECLKIDKNISLDSSELKNIVNEIANLHFVDREEAKVNHSFNFNKSDNLMVDNTYKLDDIQNESQNNSDNEEISVHR